MKRSGLKPGKGFKPRETTLARSSTLKTSKPMQRSDKPLARATAPMKAVGARARRTGQGKVPPTAAEAAWMDAAQAFGCIVCWLHFQAKTPAEIHHLKQGDRRMGHLFSIGLCADHHRGGQKEGAFISRHPWKRRFEAAYGLEDDLLSSLRSAIASTK